MSPRLVSNSIKTTRHFLPDFIWWTRLKETPCWIALSIADDEGQTALLKAGTQGVLECVRALLEAGADVTIKDKEGNTALARENKHEDVVELLKLHGARE